jgi:branched-chain amino acid transport system ATP-binding protein
MSILEVEGLKKLFGGLAAVNNVDLSVDEHTIHAIIGPNGAGKTTFFNCLTSLVAPDEGSILWKGEEIFGLPTHRVTHRGISRTFQNIRLFSFMSVLENVMTGTHNLFGTGVWGALLHNKRFKSEEKEARKIAEELLQKVGLWELRKEYARNLPYGAQRRLEIARALASRPAILLLDEPAAGMNTRETEELKDFIFQLREEGQTILIIEHDMKLVMSMADIISVLDHGVKIAEGSAVEVQNNEQVVEAYLGKRRLA